MKLTLQEIADSARLEIELARLGIEIETLRNTTGQRQKSGMMAALQSNLVPLIAALVSIATVAISGAQVWIAKINADKDLTERKMQQEREWHYKAADFIDKHSDAFFGNSTDQAKKWAGVLAVGFPDNIFKEAIVKLRVSVPTTIGPAIGEIRDRVTPLSRILSIARETLHKDSKDIVPASSLASLGADDLDVAEFVMALEETFSVEISTDLDANKKRTMAQWVSYVSQLTK
jgi:acyl carrier protein